MKKVTIKGLAITKAIHDRMIQDIEFATGVLSSLSMDCFLCVVVDGETILKEAEAAKWLDKYELYSVDWLPADIALIEKLQNSLLM